MNRLLFISALLFLLPRGLYSAADETAPVEFRLWELDGGGEVVGRLVKQTPSEVFVDIGPRIISFPAQSVQSDKPLSEIEKEAQSDVATESGSVYDPQSGSVIFHRNHEPSAIRSQQEILEDVKRGVVLVSNPAGLGTGWLINDRGQIITNHHVVGEEQYQTVTIFVKEGNQWRKQKIGNCPVQSFSDLFDIAIVQLNMEKAKELGLELYPLEIAKPGALEAGDLVYAVGNPGMGGMVLDHTISEGIVSSLARNFNDVLYLQTTAAVNPGNSGGPLLDESGKVVGLITLKAVFQEGVAFALPVDYVLQFLRNSNAYAVSESNRIDGFRYHSPQ